MLGEYWDRVRRQAPLVHCITNYVTANDVANVLLACGASPVMADGIQDVEDIARLCGALVLNLGTLRMEAVPAMELAGRTANGLGRPVVLDPVGAGASAARTRTALELLDGVKVAAVRGNISEIKALLAGSGSTQGVDAAGADRVTQDNLEAAVAFVKGAARHFGAVVAATGAVDLVSDGARCFVIRSGRPEMGRVTGTGCQLSGLTGACLAASPDCPLEGAAAAVAAMGLAGETGWANMAPADGNATYRTRIIDAVFRMDGAALDKGARYEIR